MPMTAASATKTSSCWGAPRRHADDALLGGVQAELEQRGFTVPDEVFPLLERWAEEQLMERLQAPVRCLHEMDFYLPDRVSTEALEPLAYVEQLHEALAKGESVAGEPWLGALLQVLGAARVKEFCEALYGVLAAGVLSASGG